MRVKRKDLEEVIVVQWTAAGEETHEPLLTELCELLTKPN